MIKEIVIPYTDPQKMMSGLHHKYGMTFSKKWGIYHSNVPSSIGYGWNTILIKDDIHFIRTNMNFHSPVSFKAIDPVEELIDIRIRIGEEQKSSFLNGENNYQWGMHRVNAVSVFIPKKYFKEIDEDLLRNKVQRIKYDPTLKRNIDKLLRLQFENENKALQLEGELLKYCYNLFEFIEKKEQLGIGEKKLNKINQVKNILDQQYFDAPTIRQLSRIFGMNITDLQKLFKQIHKKTIHQYCMDLKMDKAIHLVSQTNEPISQITEEVGYQNRTHFNRLYKKMIGCTPREHRRRLSIDKGGHRSSNNH